MADPGADPGADPAERPVLVFDSGVGGLSVVAAIRDALPGERIVYVADDAGFPYGDWEERALVDRILGLIGELIAGFEPKAAVIACNTASTLVLPHLRTAFTLPFVGTVPAIKPAAERTRTGVVAVLATPGTMKRDYTRDLVRSFAMDCHVRLVGAPDLASLAEAHLRGEPVADAAIWSQIAPCFVEAEGGRADIVVLACTHYPFLTDRFRRLAPWPVDWLDPAPAIARRLQTVLAEAGALAGTAAGEGEALFTAARPIPAALRACLAKFALRPLAAAEAAAAKAP